MQNLRMSAATAMELRAIAEALLWDSEDIAADAIYAALYPEASKHPETPQHKCTVIPFPGKAATFSPRKSQETFGKMCVAGSAPFNQTEHPQ